jgi:hypothetical protein
METTKGAGDAKRYDEVKTGVAESESKGKRSTGIDAEM